MSFSLSRNNLQYMVKEFKYWMDNHMVTVTRNGKSYRLARYNCEDNGPRPESYFEDYTVSWYCSMLSACVSQCHIEYNVRIELHLNIASSQRI